MGDGTQGRKQGFDLASSDRMIAMAAAIDLASKSLEFPRQLSRHKADW